MAPSAGGEARPGAAAAAREPAAELAGDGWQNILDDLPVTLFER